MVLTESSPENTEDENLENKFNSDDFFKSNKLSFAGILVGLILTGIGVLFYRTGLFDEQTKVEVIDSPQVKASEKKEIVVEVAGAVEKPGVYRFEEGARVDELLIASGGLSAGADREWVNKYINRAAKLSDGQKIYIMKTGESGESSLNNQSDTLTAKNIVGIKMDQGVMGVTGEGLVNVNTASLSVLDKLPGIGQVYGQSIIEHRPYSTVEELVSKGALKQSVYEKIKDRVTLY